MKDFQLNIRKANFHFKVALMAIRELRRMNKQINLGAL